MYKITCAVAISAVMAGLITLPDQVLQVGVSLLTHVAEPNRAETDITEVPSHNLPVQGSEAQSTLGSVDDRPNCNGQYLSSSGRMPLADAAGVHVLPVAINGIFGRFVLDTGAAYVSITPELATKARIAKSGTQLLKTVGGTMRADIAYANSIAVDRAKAEDVAVAVIPSESNPFPGSTDGLLGMSFLAHFKIDLSQNELILMPVQNPCRDVS